MTILETKEAIATALTGVAGIKGYASRPKALKPGDMFVRWGGWERAAGDAYLSTWAATLILPQGSEDAADAEAYRVADLISDALQPLMYVTQFAPTSVPTEHGPLYALTVTGRSE